MRFASTALVAALLGSTAASGCDVLGSERIGSEGGAVISDDGRMALEIPEGALGGAVDITIEVVDGPEGSASDLYVVEPMGLTFDRPVALTYDYDDQTIDGRDPASMTMVAHREQGWSRLADLRVDDEDQTVSATLMALSAVTVVIED